MLVGFILGLIAAFCYSLSYVSTRHFVRCRPPGASRTILVLSHIWMGAFSLAMLPFLWQSGLHWGTLLAPLLLCVLFYAGGQTGLVLALKTVEPSRVSTLLGFKLLVLALMTITIPKYDGSPPTILNTLHWLGVILCVVSVVALNYSGMKLPFSAAATIVFACCSYAGSDWCIGWLVYEIKASGVNATIAPLLGTALQYGTCGVIGVLLLFTIKRPPARDWRGSVPFSLAWFGASIGLFGCFSILGVLYGSILQSSRGLMSVGLGWLLTQYGHDHLEPPQPRKVFYQRLAAAALMMVAFTLYSLGNQQNATIRSGPNATPTQPGK